MIVDFNKTAKQTGIDDKETLKMLFGEFFNVCQTDIDNLPKAISAAAFNDIKLLSHNIKGAARNLWMEEIGDAAAVIEELAKESQGAGMKEAYDALTVVYNAGKNEFKNLG